MRVRLSVETLAPDADDPERTAWLAQSERHLREVWENDADDVLMSCSRHDVVLLPIPFTDLSSRKVRPAIVIGFGSYPGDIFVVPLTSRLANADFPLTDWRAAGLNVPSGVTPTASASERRCPRCQ